MGYIEYINDDDETIKNDYSSDTTFIILAFKHIKKITQINDFDNAKSKHRNATHVGFALH